MITDLGRDFPHRIALLKLVEEDPFAVANEGGGRVDVTDGFMIAGDAAAGTEPADATADPVALYVFVNESGHVHRFHGTDTVPPASHPRVSPSPTPTAALLATEARTMAQRSSPCCSTSTAARL
ncbi:hypothetical protein PR202_gb17521 [Eleusine coracana subsp. coracana]|uniref:Uncharacterized protein n=1 Tax=Eleusine coracana subsp. coracana TaxID=191504 RepID=A0AAV5F0U6_ELECO|nr:hypothetical protein PR202_gb17521 [Eleusine coracana subsp. coracana]